jgi:saccharopine dehydrogenase-like NADP-dependent oxidoreductase
VSTAIVVGAGAAGARAARQLHTSGFDVLVAERRTPRRTTVLDALRDRSSPFDGDPVDADADIAVLAHGPRDHAPLAARLLRRGMPVVSVADDPDDVRALLDLDPEARERGTSVVVGAGFSPGLSCVLAAHAATLLDRVDEIHVARAGTGGPACAQRHHRALSGAAVDWRDGGWVRRSAGSGRELCWFPDPIGGRDCYRADLPEPFLLVRAFPGVDRITARLAANRRDRMTAHLPMLRRPHPDGGPGAVRVELRGTRSGDGTATVVYGAMDVPSMATGAVAAVAAQLVLDGAVRRPGAGGLAELLDPLPVLEALAERGIKAAAFTG